MSDSLSVSVQLRIEDACARFEAAWRGAGTDDAPPRVEDYLGTAAGVERAALLRELILLDLHYRRQNGQSLTAKNYPANSPADAAVVRSVLPQEDTCATLRPGPTAERATNPEGTGPLADPAQTATEGPSCPAIPGHEFRGELGRGGMGEVVRCHDPHLGRDLAVKLLREKYRDLPSVIERFHREARIHARLQHPGIVPIHQLGELPDRRPYFTMKLVEGRTLAVLLRERTGVGDNLSRFLTIFAQVCQALAYAHSQGVIHRDLKPANVMVGAFGEVQVMDWGLAKVLTEEGGDGEAPGPPADDGAVSQTGAVLGTYAYMPPEQARGEVRRLDRRSDVFGLGAILCEILTGQPPYAGAPEEVADQAGRGHLEPALARLGACGADGELVELARQCLRERPEERPADAGAVAEAVARYQAGVQERLRAAELERAAAEAREKEAKATAAAERKARRRTRALALAVLVLMASGGAGAWLWQQQRAQTALRRQRADDAVSPDVAEAQRLRDIVKNAITLDQMGESGKALALAEKAEEVARTGGASEEVREQAAALARSLEKEVRATERDLKLLAALLAVRGPHEGPKYRAGDKGFLVALAEPSADEQFQAAFHEWDATFDVDALPADMAAARLKERPPAVVTEVIAALDEWASERRQDRALMRKDPAEWRRRWERVADLAATLDDTGPGRRELRDLLRGGGLGRERGLRMLALALRPVPVPFDAAPAEERDRLRRLAENVDVTREPVLGLLTLARALRAAGDDALAEGLLKKGVRARPQEVVLYAALGQLVESQRPPRWDDAVVYYAAARARRPELGEALANAMTRSGRVKDGLALYEQLVAVTPDNPRLHFMRGVALSGQGRHKEAEAAYREALRLKPDNLEAHSNLGNALDGQGRHKEAEAEHREAIRLKPDESKAHTNLGNALGGQGRHKEAEAEHREAIHLQPDEPAAHYNLGIALGKQGRHKEAEAAFREAIRLQSDDPDAQYNLGNALYDQDRYKEAEAAFREAIRLKPDSPDAHNNLGLALSEQGRHKEAEAEHREALRFLPDDPRLHNNLGNALGKQGRHKEAEAAFREAVRLGPDLPEAHIGLGIALAEQGRSEEAETAFREALRLRPDDPEGHYNLGTALYDQDRYKEAETAFREALRLRPDYAKAHSYLGLALSGQGRHKEAEPEFREVVRLQPDDPEAHNNLGLALNSQGRSKEAETEYREAIRLNPDYPKAHYNLGNALGGQGRHKEAEAAFREAIRLQPDYAKLHCFLGHALREQGRFAEALEALRRGHTLGIKTPGWNYPSAEWAKECERLVELDRKLSVVLQGEAEPADAAEGLALGQLCQQYKKRHAAAARLYADAFTTDPKLAADLREQHRYNAACCAALAAAGRGEDAKRLPDKVVLMLRQQALGWLRADLAFYNREAAGKLPAVREAVRQRLAHWQQDPDLASVRDKEALDKLPEAERKDWRQLWDEVAALLKKVQDTK
jgi:serine/threonine-protein kinase